MLTDLYIHSCGIISAAGSNNAHGFPQQPEYEAGQLLCKEPDYAGMIAPMQLRRMSKAVRMGIAAAKLCLQQANVEKPDAISVGTAMGCLNDTEVFLGKLVAQDEQMLTPTAFIQSTHNTVAGQIALQLGCYGHNLTYVHRGHSLEHALINAQLYLNDHEGETLLAGGIDELTPASKDLMQQAGVYGTELNGSTASEGAAFFLIGDKPAAGSLHLKNMATFLAHDTGEAIEKINSFLAEEQIDPAGIDLVLSGNSGDSRSDNVYAALKESIFKSAAHASFKQLSGEYATAVAFGLGLLVHSRKNNFATLQYAGPAPKQVRRIMLVNNYLHYGSCMILDVLPG